jgi:hypothetical protein
MVPAWRDDFKAYGVEYRDVPQLVATVEASGPIEAHMNIEFPQALIRAAVS